MSEGLTRRDFLKILGGGSIAILIAAILKQFGVDSITSISDIKDAEKSEVIKLIFENPKFKDLLTLLKVDIDKYGLDVTRIDDLSYYEVSEKDHMHFLHQIFSIAEIDWKQSDIEKDYQARMRGGSTADQIDIDFFEEILSKLPFLREMSPRIIESNTDARASAEQGSLITFSMIRFEKDIVFATFIHELTHYLHRISWWINIKKEKVDDFIEYLDSFYRAGSKIFNDLMESNNYDYIEIIINRTYTASAFTNIYTNISSLLEPINDYPDRKGLVEKLAVWLEINDFEYTENYSSNLNLLLLLRKANQLDNYPLEKKALVAQYISQIHYYLHHGLMDLYPSLSMLIDSTMYQGPLLNYPVFLELTPGIENKLMSEEQLLLGLLKENGFIELTRKVLDSFLKLNDLSDKDFSIYLKTVLGSTDQPVPDGQPQKGRANG